MYVYINTCIYIYVYIYQVTCMRMTYFVDTCDMTQSYLCHGGLFVRAICVRATPNNFH